MGAKGERHVDVVRGAFRGFRAIIGGLHFFHLAVLVAAFVHTLILGVRRVILSLGTG
ncbi:hypothetical protein B0T18DRAFT_409057 [Schizothecium vesticola]|uniref:Uncharacterized protein n=1 Tax=Schizothecium vesticola TaxID=314040 RepID=A0AA40F3Q5_9PEZI|nr:hypothetical protein B0T18DRAFT_409057 [Schizothecium vesticola]